MPLDTSALDNRFRKFFQDGKLVQVHVSKWGMSHQLTREDLGLDKIPEEEKEESNGEKKIVKPSDLPDFISLGKKYLFTDNVRLKFSRLEAQAREFLKANSRVFPIAEAHFVKQKMMIKVMSRLEAYKVEFDAATRDFLDNYEVYKQQMFELYPDFKPILEPYYPPVAELSHKFSFSYSVFEVAFPRQLKSMTMEEVLAQNIAVEAAAKKYETQMAEQYKHSLEQMENFVRESAVALRNEVVATFETIANKLQNKEVVTANNIKSIKSMIESFDALDFFDDSIVRDRLVEVKKLVNSGADFKSDAEALERLGTAVTTTLETAKNMSDVDKLIGGYIRRLDIGDEL